MGRQKGLFKLETRVRASEKNKKKQPSEKGSQLKKKRHPFIDIQEKPPRNAQEGESAREKTSKGRTNFAFYAPTENQLRIQRELDNSGRRGRRKNG